MVKVNGVGKILVYVPLQKFLQEHGLRAKRHSPNKRDLSNLTTDTFSSLPTFLVHCGFVYMKSLGDMNIRHVNQTAYKNGLCKGFVWCLNQYGMLSY